MTVRSPERWSRLGSLFSEAIELPAAEHEAFIASRCAGDAGMADELRALLDADASGAPEDFLRGVVASAANALVHDAPTGAPARTAPATGQRFGPWEVVRWLGEGGMGSVHLAVRADGAFEAQAAIKLVRGGLAGPMLARRFLSERQILASLQHPGIARLLDGGTTDDGLPYLVMEYVEGVPITAWCDQHTLTVKQRCRLFVEVCDAVGYAHRQLVVHRDIKPSNILVTPEGRAKLLDFGIATLADVVDQESEERTTLALRLMTPAYASPEQVRGERAGVASDVYALGVLLYELLAGRLPLDTRGLAPVELERRVVHEVPPPASSVAPETVRRHVRGDLDAILSRALRKEPGERYASVDALVDDLRRHLDGRPITARRDEWSYRAGRLLRRHAGAALAGATIVILLAVVGISSTIQARALALERDRAEAGRRSAEAVSDFMVGVFEISDPNESQGNAVTARALLDSGALRLERDLADQPETRAQLALTMARAYRNLGLMEKSRPLVDSSVAIRRRLFRDGHAQIAYAVLEQAVQHYDEGEYEEAIPLYEEAIRGFERASPRDDEAYVDALQGLGTSYDALRRLPEADSIARMVLALNRRMHTPPHAGIALAHLDLAATLRHQGRFAEALEHNRESVAQLRAAPDVNALDLANALNHEVSTLRGMDRSAEALPLVEEAIGIQKRVHGAPHAETAASLGNLSGLLQELGRFDESERARRESLAILRSVFGDAHPYVAGTVQSLAGVLVSAGKLAESERTYREALALHRAAYPKGHPSLGFPLTGLGRVMLMRDRPDAALPYLREAYDTRKAALPEGHWHVAASGLDLGRSLTMLKRYDEAETVLAEALTILTTTFGEADERAAQAREAIAALYDATGDAERANEVRVRPPG